MEGEAFCPPSFEFGGEGLVEEEASVLSPFVTAVEFVDGVG